jgi:hypothetical protein
VPWNWSPVDMDTEASFQSGAGPVGMGALGVEQAKRVRPNNGAAMQKARM